MSSLSKFPRDFKIPGKYIAGILALAQALLVTGTSSNIVAAQSPPAIKDDSLRRFEARYRGAKSLSATFLEEYEENGQTTRKEAGTAYFLRPGKMRWDYEAPEKNVFLVDGKYAWFYAPADRTASRMPAKSTEDWRTPLALLTSDMKLARVCSDIRAASNEKPIDPDDKIFRCVFRGSESDAEGKFQENKNKARERDKTQERPASEGGPYNGRELQNAQRAYFEVTNSGELRRIVVQEQGGIRIEFRFKNWQWNPPLDKALFEFKPPMGVAIVEGVLPDSAGARQ